MIYSSATATEPPQQPMLQPARRQNRVKMQLHSSSDALLADVNGPYHPDARPVLQQMALERTRLSSSLSTSSWKSSLDNLRGGASTDQEHDVLPTLPGCLKKILYGTGSVLFGVVFLLQTINHYRGGGLREELAHACFFLANVCFVLQGLLSLYMHFTLRHIGFPCSGQDTLLLISGCVWLLFGLRSFYWSSE